MKKITEQQIKFMKETDLTLPEISGAIISNRDKLRKVENVRVIPNGVTLNSIYNGIIFNNLKYIGKNVKIVTTVGFSPNLKFNRGVVLPNDIKIDTHIILGDISCFQGEYKNINAVDAIITSYGNYDKLVFNLKTKRSITINGNIDIREFTSFDVDSVHFNVNGTLICPKGFVVNAATKADETIINKDCSYPYYNRDKNKTYFYSSRYGLLKVTKLNSFDIQKIKKLIKSPLKVSGDLDYEISNVINNLENIGQKINNLVVLNGKPAANWSSYIYKDSIFHINRKINKIVFDYDQRLEYDEYEQLRLDYGEDFELGSTLGGYIATSLCNNFGLFIVYQ